MKRIIWVVVGLILSSAPLYADDTSWAIMGGIAEGLNRGLRDIMMQRQVQLENERLLFEQRQEDTRLMLEMIRMTQEQQRLDQEERRLDQDERRLNQEQQRVEPQHIQSTSLHIEDCRSSCISIEMRRELKPGVSLEDCIRLLCK